jgi:hypothetical protein
LETWVPSISNILFKKSNENWMKSINDLRNAFSDGSLKVFISDHDTPAKGICNMLGVKQL